MSEEESFTQQSQNYGSLDLVSVKGILKYFFIIEGWNNYANSWTLGQYFLKSLKYRRLLYRFNQIEKEIKPRYKGQKILLQGS